MTSHCLSFASSDDVTNLIADLADGADGPTFRVLRAEPVSYETVWPTIRAGLTSDVFGLADLVAWVDSDPTGLVLEALRSALVNTALAELGRSPARRRRLLSDAARFLPLRNFQICDMVDEDADILLTRALNLYVAQADAATLAVLAEALLAESGEVVPCHAS